MIDYEQPQSEIICDSWVPLDYYSKQLGSDGLLLGVGSNGWFVVGFDSENVLYSNRLPVMKRIFGCDNLLGCIFLWDAILELTWVRRYDGRWGCERRLIGCEGCLLWDVKLWDVRLLYMGVFQDSLGNWTNTFSTSQYIIFQDSLYQIFLLFLLALK